MRPLRRLLRRAALALASVALTLAAATAIFLAPPVVHTLLRVSGAAGVLGVDPTIAESLSDALVGDLVTAGAFEVPLGDAPLLSEGERAHLVDVGALIRIILLAGIGSLLVLTLTGARRRAWIREAARDGAALIVGSALLAAAAFLIAFDATFSFFHGLFFAAGTWTFDPATDRLVLLYPESFWVLAALLFCLALALISLISSRLAGRRP